jgi:hypothetical protein
VAELYQAPMKDRFETPISKCDVGDKQKLESYRAHWRKWMSWYEHSAALGGRPPFRGDSRRFIVPSRACTNLRYQRPPGVGAPTNLGKTQVTDRTITFEP